MPLLFFFFHFLHIGLFRFVFVDFVLLSLVSFYFALLSFLFVSLCFRWFRFALFRFVSFLFRFALYWYPLITISWWTTDFHQVKMYKDKEVNNNVKDNCCQCVTWVFLTFTFVVKILQWTRGCWLRWFMIDVSPSSLDLDYYFTYFVPVLLWMLF